MGAHVTETRKQCKKVNTITVIFGTEKNARIDGDPSAERPQSALTQSGRQRQCRPMCRYVTTNSDLVCHCTSNCASWRYPIGADNKTTSLQQFFQPKSPRLGLGGLCPWYVGRLFVWTSRGLELWHSIARAQELSTNRLNAIWLAIHVKCAQR